MTDKYGDVKPLDEAWMRALTVNRVHLLNLVVADDAFVTELATVGCITRPQREHLMNIGQPRDRNRTLLEFLTRRSVAHFQKFISVLSEEHADLVKLLLTNRGEYTLLISVSIMY